MKQLIKSKGVIILCWLPLILMLLMAAAPTGRVIDAVNYIQRAAAPPDTTSGLGTVWSKTDGTLHFYDNATDTDIELGAAGGYTDEESQDAAGSMLADTATIDLTYTDLTPELKADVKANSVGVAFMTASATDKLFGRDTAGAGAGAGEEIGLGASLAFDGAGNIQRAALTGDVTAVANGNSTTIANDAVTYAKMQNVSATDMLLGRSTAGAGDVEEITCTAAGRALIDDAAASNQRTTLGLVIGTDVQAYDATLAALSGLINGADLLPYFTGVDTVASASLTASGRALIDDASVAAQRTTLAVGYTVPVQALTSSPGDGVTVYLGMLPKVPVSAQGTSKIYIRRAGVIRIAEVYCYSGTAGSNEAWSLYIRLNNSGDTLVATLSVSANERLFTNSGMSLAVAAGDYIEIKSIQPTWATNPLTTIYGGYVYIE